MSPTTCTRSPMLNRGTEKNPVNLSITPEHLSEHHRWFPCCPADAAFSGTEIPSQRHQNCVLARAFKSSLRYGTTFQESNIAVTSARKPRFQIGDRVRVVWPLESEATRQKSGDITEVVRSPADVVYRYRVTFSDGTVKTFFGFELEPETRNSD